MPSFDALFADCYARLLAWCRAHAPRSLGEPEDFVHQTYLRCRRRWSADRASVGHGGAYLFRALRWVVADAARRAGRRPRTTALTFATAAVDERPDRTLAARETLAALTPAELAVCRAHLDGDGGVRGRSAAAVAVHLCRARSKLRRHLGLTPGAGRAIRLRSPVRRVH